jgi:hypothetical protein
MISQPLRGAASTQQRSGKAEKLRAGVGQQTDVQLTKQLKGNAAATW